jgi:hypothetical protein
MKYYVKAMDATGQEIAEFVNAESEEEAINILRKSGYFVTSVVLCTDKKNYIPVYNKFPAIFAENSYLIIVFLSFCVGLILGICI